VPELPEVQTTVDGLNRVLPGKKILDVWSGYNSSAYKGKQQIKNRIYYHFFKKVIIGRKFIKSERVGKNILLHLSDKKTIVIHMKMTGHLMFGKYQMIDRGPKKSKKDVSEKWQDEKWLPNEPLKSALWDPWNRHIRLVFALSGGKHLVLSDVRKFAKVFVEETDKLMDNSEIGSLGPDPLKISFKEFMQRINSRQSGKIKQVLLDQKVLSGIGNIYSDEALWEVGVHPATDIKNISEKKYREVFSALNQVLKKGIKFSGDSTSDYRRVDGKKGEFQKKHQVYGRKGESCLKKDGGKIKTMKVGGRTAHFCPIHQKKY